MDKKQIIGNMIIYQTIGGQYPIHDKMFPKGTVVLKLKNKDEIYCYNFRTYKGHKLLADLYSYSKHKWYKCYVDDKYACIMRKYHAKVARKKKKRIKEDKTITSYNSSEWIVNHPYQGGGFTPK